MPFLTMAVRYWYLIVILALAGVATYYHIDRDRVEARWQAKWDARDAGEALAMAKAAEASRAAYEAATKRNQEVEAKLHDTETQRDAALHDADLARRLLAAAQDGGRADPVPQGHDQPGTAEAGPPGRTEGIGERLAAYFAECRANADQLDALLEELLPQL